jgi:hypothetical protein
MALMTDDTVTSATVTAGRRRARRRYGESVDVVTGDGRPVVGGVFDERQVRVAAGITMALGAVAFADALLAKNYLPIRTVTAFFFVDFTLRVWWGLGRSPVGVLARVLTRVLTPAMSPDWVSAAPKRFAWTLGLVMSVTMTVITNARITGLLPMTICTLCLTLMWLEAVLGLCLGCQVYRLLVARGWISARESVEICSDGACQVDHSPSAVSGSAVRRPVSP